MNWSQLKTILWLRWQLTRHQWARGGGLGAVIAAIVAVGALVLGAGSFVGGILAGIFAMRTASPMVVMAVWLALTGAFLFTWLLGLITDLQRSETIDLQQLMHLPVQLGQIFVINYAASHLAFSIVVLVPAMTGLAIGMAISRGAAMLLLIPLAFGMVFMITAWTYCLRGWLATLMSNPRRRRAVIMGVTAVFVVLAQAPNFYFNVIRRSDRSSRSSKARAEEPKAERDAREAREEAEIKRLLEWQVAAPPLWVPVGAKALAESRVLPALGGTAGVFFIGALGLRRAYRSTLRFYQGDVGGAAAAKRPVAVARSARPPTDRPQLIERRIPGVPEQAAAVAVATLRSMLRAPEVKMQWGTSFVVTLLLGAPLLFRGGSGVPANAGPFIATGVVAFSMFMLVAIVANQFGFDRDGFRAFVLSPVDRRLILIGKNLAMLPAAATSALVLLTVVSIWLRLSPLVVLAALLQLVVGLLVAGVGGNLLSILVPFRIQAGSMKPSKMPAKAMIMLVMSQMSFPLAMAPLFAPALVGYVWHRYGGPPASVVDFTLSLALALVMALVYYQTLGPLGRLLRRREMKILETVSALVE